MLNASQDERTETQVNPFRLYFRNFRTRLTTLCGCTKAMEEETQFPQLQAVDSEVRLVYMRRIEEASSLHVQVHHQRTNTTPLISPRTIHYRRKKNEHGDLAALEKALKEYESKNKKIISNTKMPDISSFNKPSRTSRESQTSTTNLSAEDLRIIGTRIDPDPNNEQIKRMIVYNSTDDQEK